VGRGGEECVCAREAGWFEYCGRLIVLGFGVIFVMDKKITEAVSLSLLSCCSEYGAVSVCVCPVLCLYLRVQSCVCVCVCVSSAVSVSACTELCLCLCLCVQCCVCVYRAVSDCSVLCSVHTNTND
jgi:hypothetical protein